MPNFLAVDIGNTVIHLGVFSGNRLLKTFSISTALFLSEKMKKKINGVNPGACVVCSVVPKATKLFAEGFKKYYGFKPSIIGKDIKVPMKNRYRSPKQLGQDRLVNAYAGVNFYGTPLVVIDFGTGLTFDVISANKEYLGGMIFPGLKMSLEALSMKTALLPKIKLKVPPEFIGKDTENCMLSGIVYGYASLCDEMIVRIKKRIGNNAKAIVTGGNAAFIKPFCRRITGIDEFLTLKGIRCLYDNADKEI